MTYTKLQKESLVCPISHSYGDNFPRLIDELVPSEATVLEDIVVGFEYFV